METVSIETIGSKAVKILGPDVRLQVQGITSRGVFLNTEREWMVFLSGEKYRGPLTINLPEFDRYKFKFRKGNEGRSDGKVIRFPVAKMNLDLSTTRVWKPKPLLSISDDVFARAVQKVSALDVPGFETLLGSEEIKSSTSGQGLDEFRKISALIGEGDITAVLEIAESLLGLGQGLTPEGDDLLIGLIYQLRVVSNEEEETQLELYQFIQHIVSLAREKTTRLSANLIACAAEGLVDERISRVLQALYFEEVELDSAIQELFTWGNSSGRMVLAGMIAGVLARGN